MNGIILINKPTDFTSHDVVAKTRGILKTKKIGHSGTLDPMATGVLPIFIGNATKAISRIANHDKSYTATIKLGISTDTLDITGTVTSKQTVKASEEDFHETLCGFKGLQKQIPPMYSAVQVDGVRLYQLARKGIEIEREAREIEIYNIMPLNSNPKENEYTIKVDCSKGTYIRTLCSDIGDKLGCGGVLTQLVRTKAHGFHLGDSITLQQLEEFVQNGTIEDYLITVESLFTNLPKITLTPELEKHFFNGVHLWLTQFDLEADNEDRAVYDSTNKFIAVAMADKEKKQLTSFKIFI